MSKTDSIKQRSRRMRGSKPAPTSKGGAIEPEPSPNGANGRGVDGRFRAGNPGGPGNPRAKQTADLRASIRAAVSHQDMEEIVAALIRKAKTGDVVAVRELLDRLIGKSSQKVEMDVQTHQPQSRADSVKHMMELDMLCMLPMGVLECAVNDGLVAPKEARRAERIKEFMAKTRAETNAEPDEPPGSGKFGAWRRTAISPAIESPTQ